jgi:hypothetical protein
MTSQGLGIAIRYRLVTFADEIASVSFGLRRSVVFFGQLC